MTASFQIHFAVYTYSSDRLIRIYKTSSKSRVQVVPRRIVVTGRSTNRTSVNCIISIAVLVSH